MSHTWMSHEAPTNESCSTYINDWVLLNESRRTHEYDISHIPQMIYECVKLHRWMGHDIHICVIDMTHSSVQLDAFIVKLHRGMSQVAQMNEFWRTDEWVMLHIWMRHVASMNASWRTDDWVMSHVWMSHGAQMIESCRTYEWVMSHV